MLQSFSEESLLSESTRIVVHYLVRKQEETLFLKEMSKVKNRFGSRFKGHLWITRQTGENSFTQQEAILEIHSLVASTANRVGRPWDWWDSFREQAVAKLDTPQARKSRLVYICGPQGLTDRLVTLYENRGLSTKDGQVQIEKWW